MCKVTNSASIPKKQMLRHLILQHTKLQKASEVCKLLAVFLPLLPFYRLLLPVCIIGMFTRSAECEKLLLLRKTHEIVVPLQLSFRGSNASLSSRVYCLNPSFLNLVKVLCLHTCWCFLHICTFVVWFTALMQKLDILSGSFWCMIEFLSLSCNIRINWIDVRLGWLAVYCFVSFCFSKRCPVKFQISLLNELDIWFKFWNVGPVVETMGTACKFNMKEMRRQKVCEMVVKESRSLGLNDVSILPQKGCRSGCFQLYYWVF